MANNPARKWWALVAIAASVLVVGLDLTVLNLALPTIATDLHASSGDLQWISDAYSLVLAAAMLPAGLLGDRLGRKKVLLVALVLPSPGGRARWGAGPAADPGGRPGRVRQDGPAGRLGAVGQLAGGLVGRGVASSWIVPGCVICTR